MSTKSGKTTSRKQVAVYKGFSIIRVKVTEWYKPSYSDYYTNIPNKVHSYFEFCKEGEETRPSQAYSCSFDEIGKCKCAIDSFLEDDSLYFTEEEKEKYVHKPNRKCGYAYGYNSLMKVMREHQKADKRIKILLEDRLEDANFHSWSGLLAQKKYKEYEELAAKKCTFPEKFEVYTHTLRKRIKDPKNLEEGINKAISDYLASQGIKDTSVEVKFIEEW